MWKILIEAKCKDSLVFADLWSPLELSENNFSSFKIKCQKSVFELVYSNPVLFCLIMVVPFPQLEVALTKKIKLLKQ